MVVRSAFARGAAVAGVTVRNVAGRGAVAVAASIARGWNAVQAQPRAGGGAGRSCC